MLTRGYPRVVPVAQGHGSETYSTDSINLPGTVCVALLRPDHDWSPQSPGHQCDGIANPAIFVDSGQFLGTTGVAPSDVRPILPGTGRTSRITLTTIFLCTRIEMFQRFSFMFGTDEGSVENPSFAVHEVIVVYGFSHLGIDFLLFFNANPSHICSSAFPNLDVHVSFLSLAVF